MKKRITAVLLTLCMSLSSIAVFAYEPNWWAVDTVKGAMEYSLISTEYGDKPYTDAINRLDFINVAVNIYCTITESPPVRCLWCCDDLEWPPLALWPCSAEK